MDVLKQCTRCVSRNIEEGVNIDDTNSLVLKDDGTGTFYQDWHCKDCGAFGMSLWTMKLIKITTEK